MYIHSPCLPVWIAPGWFSRGLKNLCTLAGSRRLFFSDWQGGCRSCCPPPPVVCNFRKLPEAVLSAFKEKGGRLSLGHYKSARRRIQARRLRCLSTLSTYKYLRIFAQPGNPYSMRLCGIVQGTKFLPFGYKTPTVWVQNSYRLGTKLLPSTCRISVPFFAVLRQRLPALFFTGIVYQ